MGQFLFLLLLLGLLIFFGAMFRMVNIATTYRPRESFEYRMGFAHRQAVIGLGLFIIGLLMLNIPGTV